MGNGIEHHALSHELRVDVVVVEVLSEIEVALREYGIGCQTAFYRHASDAVSRGLYEACAHLHAEIYTVHHASYVHIFNIGAAGEMLDHCSTVNHGGDASCLRYDVRERLGHISQYYTDTAAEQFLIVFCEIVVEQALQTVLCLFLRRSTHHAPNNRHIVAVYQFFENMYAQIARSPGKQHAANVLEAPTAESIKGILLQEGIEWDVVEVAIGSSLTAVWGLTNARNQSRQLSWRRISEDITIGHVHPMLVGFDDNSCHIQRRTAKVEETVSSPYPLSLQHLCKDIAEGLLHLVLWCHILTDSHHLRFWQCLCIDLTIRCDWHLGQLQIGCRNHIGSQTFADFCLHLVDRYLTIGNKVCTDMIPSLQFANEYDDVVDTLNLHHHTFNLAQFDTLSS